MALLGEEFVLMNLAYFSHRLSYPFAIGTVIFTGAKSVVILVRWASERTSNTAYSSSVKIIGNVFVARRRR